MVLLEKPTVTKLVNKINVFLTREASLHFSASVEMYHETF
jgi:hypothetical protein